MSDFGEQLREAEGNMLRAEGVVAQALAHKALLQSAILDLLAGDYPTIGGEEPMDKGIFRVYPTTAEIDWQSPTGELTLSAGQCYLDFHMPKADTVERANESYAEIARYMRSRLDITHIIGVTYRVMAMRGKRDQGFNIEQLDLPEEVMAYATAYWQNMMPDAKARQFESAYVVWMDRDTFINLFDGPVPFDRSQLP